MQLKNFVPLLIISAIALTLTGEVLLPQSLTAEILFGAIIIGTLPLIWDVVASIFKGKFGVDLIAIVAILAALWLHENLAAAVILLMLSGGELLEEYAIRKSRHELSKLLNAAPTIAHKQLAKGELKDVPLAEIMPTDLVVVKPGEMIPVDGVVIAGEANVDESNLTGESLPLKKAKHATVLSGSINQDGLLTIKATKPSSESKFAQIIKLIKQAEANRAPFVRLADRYSVFFTVVAFAIAGAAWLLSGDPLRAVLVLVVATPCPLILATPIAFAAGISRSASRGIILKNGGVIEKLATAQAFVFDKTGTLTFGVPEIARVELFSKKVDANMALQIAASLDQLSQHILAQALVKGAQNRGLALEYPAEFSEEFGDGVKGKLAAGEFSLGKLNFLKRQGVNIAKVSNSASTAGEIHVFLAQGKKLLAVIYLTDTVRPNVLELFTRLRKLAVQKIVMLTGDKEEVAQRLAKAAGITDYRAECLPEDKVAEIQKLKQRYSPVVMVGDGVNDAPALVTADAGIAMGRGTSTATTAVGDMVILVDDISRVAEAVESSQYVLEVARQGICLGIGLSIGLMIAGAFGLFSPVTGALLQEAIDVTVIFNALRVSFVTKR